MPYWGMGKARARWANHWWWLVAGVVLVGFFVTLSWRLATPSAPSVTGPCATKELRVTMFATQYRAGGRVQSALLRVTNLGPGCDLMGDSPLVQPVAGPGLRPVGRGDVADDVRRRPVHLATGASALSQVSVEGLPASYRRRCGPRTVLGLELALGRPVGSTIYVAHRFRGVCSNPSTDNVGATWYVAG